MANDVSTCLAGEGENFSIMYSYGQLGRYLVKITTMENFERETLVQVAAGFNGIVNS